MDMLKVSVRWTGFVGAPGYSNFYFAGGGGLISDAQQVTDRVHTALGSLTGGLPSSVTLNIDPEVEVIDSDTGVIQGYQQVDPDNAISGTGTGGYSGPSGGVVNWRTDDLRNGRRIRGRTFIVPMDGDSYESDGTLSTAALTQLNNFASVLRTGDFDSELGVWSRPVGGSGGVFATVTGHSVPDMAAVLRSRRD